MTTLQTTFVLLAAGIILGWLLLAVSGPRKIDLPKVIAVLRYGSLLRTVALVLALAPPCVMIFAMLSFTWRNQTMLIVGGVSFLVASVLAGLLLVETEAGQTVITEDGLRRFSLWAGWIHLPWTQVERVDYSSLNQWFIVRGAGRAICVSYFLVDVHMFAATARKKLSSSQYDGAAAVFAKLQ
jgi:hypothetical protein